MYACDARQETYTDIPLYFTRLELKQAKQQVMPTPRTHHTKHTKHPLSCTLYPAIIFLTPPHLRHVSAYVPPPPLFNHPTPPPPPTNITQFGSCFGGILRPMLPVRNILPVQYIVQPSCYTIIKKTAHPNCVNSRQLTKNRRA